MNSIIVFILVRSDTGRCLGELRADEVQPRLEQDDDLPARGVDDCDGNELVVAPEPQKPQRQSILEVWRNLIGARIGPSSFGDPAGWPS